MTPHARPIEILLVEDNLGDIELIQEAFAASRSSNRIHVVGDGVEAIDFLKRRGNYAGALRPDVVLLDLNMPRMDGKEVLEVVKQDPEIKTIPVIVLTSSEAERDIVKSYKLHANSYINKPADLEHFMEVVQAVEDVWLVVAKLPGKKEEAA